MYPPQAQQNAGALSTDFDLTTEKAPLIQVINPFTTSPKTSVSRKSRPLNR
jgi:hypothetical protein